MKMVKICKEMSSKDKGIISGKSLILNCPCGWRYEGDPNRINLIFRLHNKICPNKSDAKIAQNLTKNVLTPPRVVIKENIKKVGNGGIQKINLSLNQ
jgi:hypothetical protein